MTIVCVYSPDFQPLYDLVAPVWIEYSRRHGYDMLFKELARDASEHYTFTKCRWLAHKIEHGFSDRMFIIDLDMLPTNLTIPLDSFNSYRSDMQIEILMTKDINGWNSGSFFLWPNKLAHTWLKTIVALKDHTTSEQHAMWWINEAFGVGEQPHPSFNSIDYAMYPDFNREFTEGEGQWKPGHLLVHLPGMSLKQRLELFPTYTKHIIR